MRLSPKLTASATRIHTSIWPHSTTATCYYLPMFCRIQVALNVLKAYTPTTITGVVGNITSAVSDKFLIETDGCVYMDVLQNNFFEDSHYFDQPDNYSEDDKINMANNISLYWA